MHKPFYASGFFYHQASHQILLQQQIHGEEIKFVLFRGQSGAGNDPKVVFRECVEEVLGTAINATMIRPVYDYVHEKFGMHYIFFVEVGDKFVKKFKETQQTQWISLAKLTKHNMSEQTRHDIIVGERVIRSLTQPPAALPNSHV